MSNLADPPSGPTPRFLAFLFGGFGLMALLVLVGSWPGYQRSRRINAAKSAMELGDNEAVIENLAPVLAKYPQAWGRQVELGDAYLEIGKAAEALKAYEASLAANPDQNLSARIGRAKFLLGQKPEAIKLLKQAVEKDVNDARANYFIALYYMDEGNYARAAFFFEAAGSDKKLLEKSRPYLDEIRKKLLESPPAPPAP